MPEALDIGSIIINHADTLRGVMLDEVDLEDCPLLFGALYRHYLESGQMPIGTAKSRTGDALEWIWDHLVAEPAVIDFMLRDDIDPDLLEASNAPRN